MKKVILIIFLLLISSGLSQAATYCINKASGNDSNTGISAGAGTGCAKCDSDDSAAWANATKLDSITFSAGDFVCGKKGETHTYTTSAVFNSSGTAGSFVSVDGWATAGNWTNEGSNIWSITMAEYPKRVKLSSTEYDEAHYVFTFTDDNSTTYQGVDSTYRWAWRPIEHTAATMKLYVYATSNPSSFYSNIEYEDHSGYITIGTYGSGAKPIIEIINQISGSNSDLSWSDATGDGAPTNTYKMTLATDPTRLWFEGVEQPSGDRLTAGGADTHRISATYPWLHTGSTLYVYSAAGNPGTAITLMEGLQDGVVVMSFANRSNIKFTGWDLRGGSNAVISFRGSSNIIIDNMTIGYGGYGVLGTGGAASTYTINSKIIVRDSSLDHQQRWSDLVGYDDMSGVSDGIHFRESCEWCLVYRNTVANYDHDGVTLETVNSTSLNFTNGDYHVRIFSNEIHSANNYDGRCFTTYGRSGKCTYNEYFYNDCHNITAQAKFDGGPGNHAHHNYFHVGRNPFYNDSNTQGISEFITYICSESTQVSTSNLLEHNLFYDNDEPAIRFDQQSSGSCTKENHIIRNNIFLNNGTDSEASSIAGDFVQMQVEIGDNVGANIFKNNLFYHSGGTAQVAYGGSFNDSTPYSISGFNALTGSDGNTISGNVIGNPLIENIASENFEIPISSPAYNAGIDGASILDWYGYLVSVGSPDIGLSEAQVSANLFGLTLYGVKNR